MNLEIQQVEAASLCQSNFPIPQSAEVRENLEGTVKSHLKFMNDFYSSKKMKDPNEYWCLIAIDADKNEIIAFRFFYFEPNTSNFELFSIYVMTAYRQQGIATELFQQALKIANAEGCQHCIVRFGSPNNERKCLLESYKRYAQNHPDSFSFTFYYRNEKLEFNNKQPAQNAVKAVDVQEVIFDFSQRCFIGEKKNNKFNLAKEEGLFRFLSKGTLTVMQVHQMSKNHQVLLKELLTQYIMFLQMNPKLQFPNEFLNGSTKSQLGEMLLQYICEHRWPFPQMLNPKKPLVI